ncbi:hypothetical protein [Tunicatimonas pelagia]|nr:hypothetical protein [Tunicatimonas pelagia]WKN43630.1 hypothetical protein P0M28_01435 [Tunicatimonas pelagia]
MIGIILRAEHTDGEKSTMPKLAFYADKSVIDSVSRISLTKLLIF